MRNKDYEKLLYVSGLFDEGTDEGAESTVNEQDNAGEKPEAKTYTEDELNAIVDKIVSGRLARERKDAEKKTKAAEEAARLEKLTAEQKLQEKADALQKKIDELEEKEARSQMAKSARKILQQENMSLPDEIVSVLITKDADTTKSNVESFVKLFKKAVQDGIAAELKGKSPKTGETTKPTMTKEQIFAIKDPAKRRQAINDNIQLFKK